MTSQMAYELRCKLLLKTFVAKKDGEAPGFYYIKATGMGPGSHVLIDTKAVKLCTCHLNVVIILELSN